MVQTATFETNKFSGKLSVNWDFVASPNILYPITAAPAYKTVDSPMLTRKRKKENKLSAAFRKNLHYEIWINMGHLS